ncbi:hypothetical protein JAAARDRAFT_188175 [Jaapia argillacea MUCL 33604]|uniref:Aminotransferase class I/classII large domain-containing protein n=1 Tax=Jaapia argillacea MUCL 33604 TaxID=933084 RepID=A0A067QFH2_9AGAM|nr:hypothetical protein JAAARDRAFT_188175 [Jaapia argillacea MUCL 33604]
MDPGVDPVSVLASLDLNDGPVFKTPHLSKRAKQASEFGALIDRLSRLFSDQYSDTNPNGIINFGVAENLTVPQEDRVVQTLMQAEMKKFLDYNLNLTDIDFTYGDSVAGSTRIFGALCRLFEKYFNPVTPVLPEHIVTGVGLSAVIDQLTQLLCDEGEAVLIAKPYYNGFDNDISARSKGILVGVDTGDVDPTSPQTLEAFEVTIQELKAKGIVPRAVIVCHPHNPLGFNYPKETLLAYCRFCEKHDLHLLSDEIYALSQFKNTHFEKPVPFVSMLSIDVKKEAGCNPARVHVLYGMSKDWCANGFRIGVFVTQHNPDLRKTFCGIAILMKISSPADTLWSAILNDDEMLDSFVKTNQERLTNTFVYCQKFFEKHNIPIVQPQAAHFIFIDLRKYMRSFDDEGKAIETPEAQEMDLFSSFLKGSLYVAPGGAYHHTVPGWFRFTFCVRRDVLDVGLGRFENVLNKSRN